MNGPCGESTGDSPAREPLRRRIFAPRRLEERLFATYEGRIAELCRDVSLAEVKLGDYQARLRATLPHEPYIEELTTLREELKVLSTSQQSEGAKPKTRLPAKVAALIQALHNSHTMEAEIPMRKER